MGLAEILNEIPTLSFAERQTVVRRIIGLDEEPLTAHEKEILDERLSDFQRNPGGGISLDDLKSHVRKHLSER